MVRRFTVLGCATAAALCLVAPLPSAATGGTVSATVLSIGDGDSLRVRQAGRVVTVRLACIDAAELNQAPHGQEARDALRLRLRVSSSVSLRVKSTDRFGRTVAEVISNASDPVNIGLALVESGQAFVYRRYLGQCNARAYLAAEERASRRRSGVWQVVGGITRPWEFRRGGNGGSSGRRYSCRQIGSHGRAQQLLRQGHTYLDGNGDGEACESLR